MQIELSDKNNNCLASNKLNFIKVINEKHTTHWISLKNNENINFIEVCLELEFTTNEIS